MNCPATSWSLTGPLSGRFDRSSLPADGSLKLKAGAQVMLVNNDKYGRWVNGSLGMVAGIGEDDEGEKAVLVELQDGVYRIRDSPYLGDFRVSL